MAEGWDQFGPDYDFPEYEGKPHRYLIASTSRCGSHFLGHLLHGTGVLGSPLEYYHPAHAKKWMGLLGENNAEAMMAALYRRRTSPSGWFGVKAHWVHMVSLARDPANRGLLKFDKYIEIRRRDRIAQAISFEVARQTNAWISFQESRGTPEYDFEMLHKTEQALSDYVTQWDAFFRNRNLSRIVVEYEDLMADPETAISTILADFGLTRAEDWPAKWQPARQASALNAEWRERYLEDLAKRAD